MPSLSGADTDTDTDADTDGDEGGGEGDEGEENADRQSWSIFASCPNT